MTSTDIKTSDIILSAYLRCLGYPLAQLVKEGNRGVFYFTDVDTEDIQDYDPGRAKVEPAQFSQAVRTLTVAARR